MARTSSDPTPVMDRGQASGTTDATGTAAAGTTATRTTATGARAKKAAGAGASAMTAPRQLSGPWGASFDGTGAKGLTFERRHTRPDIHP